jgi:hypothetical protein
LNFLASIFLTLIFLTGGNFAVGSSLRNTASNYDALDRITGETSAGISHSYPLYDKVGNRLQTMYGGTGRALVCFYDALNRLQTCEERDALATASGRISGYLYDLGGKVTRKLLPNGVATSRSYDFLGRTLGITEKTASGPVIQNPAPRLSA